MGFGVFLVHPPMASVLLSALVERCFVSRMREFFSSPFQFSFFFFTIVTIFETTNRLREGTFNRTDEEMAGIQILKVKWLCETQK